VEPYIGGGAHYGFNAWQRKSGTVTVNGEVTDLSYDDIWGKMFHADLGMQWMAPGGFTAEFGAARCCTTCRRREPSSGSGSSPWGWAFISADPPTDDFDGERLKRGGQSGPTYWICSRLWVPVGA